MKKITAIRLQHYLEENRFGLKTGIDFDHYGLKSSMVFKGTIGAYKRMSFRLQMNSREREVSKIYHSS